MSARLISIIGPPGVGKTTVAELLAGRLGAELIREDYAGNPFLAESYQGSAAARLPGQLYFLISRVSQLSLLNWPATGMRVSDYGYCQDAVFAEMRLDGGDLEVYRRLAGRLGGLVRPPDVVVHLDACPATLRQRIASRARAFEQRAMREDFLSALRRRYDDVAAGLDCPVVRIDCDHTDLRQPASLQELIEAVS